MNQIASSISCVLFLFLSFLTTAQTNKETAKEKFTQAIELVDKGKFDEGIKLLEESQKLYGEENFTYPYEIAYAYYHKEDYKQAVKILENAITKYKNPNARAFQLLGNAYDIMGNPKKAIEWYQTGLKKFPNSGELYLELGNLQFQKKEYAKALPFYEKGIEISPQFPSNYYRSTQIYCNSSERVWGMIYGEIFMNLERNSERTLEISKLT